ncbi:MAG: hypothetical protein HKN33_00305, partial [Pyrinomonadaceae bacterium]|nr:hypothetical protein [Pyrinomonadaceae bacterium]
MRARFRSLVFIGLLGLVIPAYASSFPGTLGRQNVMDDGYTFFDAEPVKEYDSAKRLNKDVGWYLISNLRVLGDYPKRSAFRVVVKKGAAVLAETRCEGVVYTKAGDYNLSNGLRKKGRDLTYENFMYTQRACKDEA